MTEIDPMQGLVSRQIIIRQTGGPEALELVEAIARTPAAGEVVIKAEAIGVGWPDILIRRGSYRWMPPLPASPGSDLSGHIVAVGAGVDEKLLGQPVLVTARELSVRGGCYADYIVVPGSAPFLLPDHADLDEAVCLPNYQVAWNLVHEAVTGRPITSVFVNGIAGGVGSGVVQLAKAAGITVFGSVSTSERAQFARQLGADHVLDRRTENVVKRVLEITGGEGVDLVLDHVGGAAFSSLIGMLAKWGTIVSYNTAEGLPQDNLLAALRANGARCPSIRIFEMHLYDDDRENRRRTMEQVIRSWVAGEIAPVISARLPLERAAEAHAKIESGDTFGKVVLKPSLRDGNAEQALKPVNMSSGIR